MIAPQTFLLMTPMTTPLATPFKKQSNDNYNCLGNNDLDMKYNGGNDDDNDSIYEVKNADCVMNNDKYHSDNKNYDDN